jgi:probable blue pigment (indigoidine) exporter
MAPSSLGWRHLIALTLAAAAWGLGTVVSKRAVAEFPALTLLSIQLAASLTTLAIVARLSGTSLRGSPALLSRLGILNPGVAYALSLLGLMTVSVSLSVMLWALEPVLILGLAAAFLGERVTIPFLGLSAVALAGMALLLYEPAASGQLVGIALTIAGVGCCAAYTIISRRFLPGTTDSAAPVVFAQQAHALAFALLITVGLVVAGGHVLPEAVTPIGIASALGSGVLYYAAAYLLYLSALRSVPASVAAVSFYLIPIFGVAGGSLLLGDRLQPLQWAGVIVVLVAIAAIARWTQLPTVGLATAVRRAGKTKTRWSPSGSIRG